jgi:acyl-coenzyme A synthetase/AMP-(fatty) acid ligase
MTTDGWWGTPDVGLLDADGMLEVVGRIDDTVRTASGQLVNLGYVSATLADAPGVRDAVALPMELATGPVIGALAEVEPGVGADELRRHLEHALPAVLQPRFVEVTDALPRLADGRPDRHECLMRLARGTP